MNANCSVTVSFGPRLICGIAPLMTLCFKALRGTYGVSAVTRRFTGEPSGVVPTDAKYMFLSKLVSGPWPPRLLFVSIAWLKSRRWYASADAQTHGGGGTGGGGARHSLQEPHPAQVHNTPQDLVL